MRIYFLSLLMLLAGCTVRFPQLAYFQNEISSNNLLDDHKWRLTYGAYQTHVYAIDVPSGIVFANESDDALLYDGNDIKRVVKIGSSIGLTEISSHKTSSGMIEKVFTSLNTVLGVHRCEHWKQNAPLSFEQICHSDLGKEYKNSKRYSENGELLQLEMGLNDFEKRLYLSRGIN